MRCAERGPTPGSTRSASTSRSRPFAEGTSSLRDKLQAQNGSLKPAGSPRPAVMPPIFSAMVDSTLRAASLKAAATRSSSISRSSPTREGSMVTRFTSYLQVIWIFTSPAPDWPSTSSVARLSCMRFMFSCIICACFISCPILPFMSASFSFLLDSRVDDLRVEQVDEVLHEAVGLDRLRGRGAPRLALAGLERRGAHAARLAHGNLEDRRRAEMLLERGFQLVGVDALGEVCLALRDRQLEGGAIAARELGIARELACCARQRKLLHELGPRSGALRSRRRLRCSGCRGGAWRALYRHSVGPEREHAKQRHHEAAVLVRRERQVFARLQRDLVIELHRFGIDARAELRQSCSFGIVLQRARHRLRERELEKKRRQLGECRIEGKTARLHVVGDLHGLRSLARGHRPDEREEVSLVNGPEHVGDIARLKLPRSVGDCLVEKRQGV